MKLLIPFSLTTILLFVSLSSGQTCSPPPIVANAKAYNIFSPEQEMIFGDLIIERTVSDYREIDDPVLSAYVDRIAAKLIRHLPSTGLTYHFHIIDLNDTNAFNIPADMFFFREK
jgi:predicted Zn-dependent protease